MDFRIHIIGENHIIDITGVLHKHNQEITPFSKKKTSGETPEVHYCIYISVDYLKNAPIVGHKERPEPFSRIAPVIYIYLNHNFHLAIILLRLVTKKQRQSPQPTSRRKSSTSEASGAKSSFSNRRHLFGTFQPCPYSHKPSQL